MKALNVKALKSCAATQDAGETVGLRINVRDVASGLFALWIAASAGWSVIAADPPARAPEQLEQFLKRYPEADANMDGVLTVDEARAYRTKLRAGAASAPPNGAAESAAPSDSAPAKTKRDAAAKTKQYDRSAGSRPDLEDVPYGEHERLKLDLWKAKSDKPTPILVFFHGGGGDKLMYRGSRLLEFCLQNGVSAAAVNYRPNNQFPFPVPMQDATRAIQFLRHKAADYNIDPAQVAATGTSLGANVSTWMAYHDDVADPKSDDPVLRQSSRLRFVIAGAGQTFNDMELFKQRVYPYPVRGRPEPGNGAESSEKAREISAIYHVTADDPPILMTYGFELRPLPLAKDTPIGELIHNPAFGLLLKEKLDELGIENHFYHGGNKAPADAQETFVIEHFFGKSARPQ